MLWIELAQFVGPAERDQIGQAIALRLIKRAPMVAGADDIRRRDAGQALTGSIPDHDAPPRIEHEGGDDQMLHQPHGIGLCDV